MNFSDLHSELRRLILSQLDRASLLSVIQTSRFLRHEGEELLYSVVTFRSDKNRESGRAKLFIRSIIRNPTLGQLVNDLTLPMFFDDWFYPSIHGSDQQKNPSALVRTVWRGMPNLKSLDLKLPRSGIQYFLSQTPTFKLDRLKLDALVGPAPLSEAQILHILQSQPQLRHLSLPSGPLPTSSSSVTTSRETELGEAQVQSDVATNAFQNVCRNIKILEGRDWTVFTFLPGRKVDHLSWTAKDESPFRPSTPQQDIFTPTLCDAYSRLQNLSLQHNVSSLSKMAPHLTSLTGLVLHIDEDPTRMFKSRTLQKAIEGIKDLQTLVLVIHATMTPRLRTFPNGMMPGMAGFGVQFEDHGWIKGSANDGTKGGPGASFLPATAASFFEGGKSLKTVTALYVHDQLVGEAYESIVFHCTSYQRGFEGPPQEMKFPQNTAPLREIPPSFFSKLNPGLTTSFLMVYGLHIRIIGNTTL